MCITKVHKEGIIEGLMQPEQFISCFDNINFASSMSNQQSAAMDFVPLWKEY